MRILLAGNYYPEHSGGIETVTAQLAARYRAAGHTVRWMAAELARFPHRTHADDLPVPAWNLTEDRLGFPYPIPDPLAYRRITSAVSWSDVLHLHDCLYAANVVAWLRARTLRRPVLLTQHVGPVPYASPLLRAMQATAYATLGRIVPSHVEAVTFVSRPVEQWFSRRIGWQAPPPVIPNGVDLESFRPVSEAARRQLRVELGLAADRAVLLFVGRFTEKKGLARLQPLMTAEKDWQWVLIGRAGSVRPASWGAPQVRVLEPIAPPALQQYYAAADLLVLPSRGEGLPMVVQEAMACGTPAVVSKEVAAAVDAPGMVFGTSLEAGALSKTIVDALARLAQDPGIRDRCTSLAADRWAWDSVSRRYLAILQRLAEPAQMREAA